MHVGVKYDHKQNSWIYEYDFLTKTFCYHPKKTYPAFLYGQSEKRIRMDHGTGNGSHLAKKKRKNKNKSKRSYNVNRSLTNNSNRNAHNYDSQRTRSKTEINYRNGPMEFWEWNGTKWVMKKLNDSVKVSSN